MSNAASNELVVANTIVKQIGERAFAMMGATNRLGSANHLQFKICQNAKRVTHVTVTLTGRDEYTVRFDRVTKIGFSFKTGKTTGGVKMLAEVEGVSVETLRRTIEEHTGLYLSL